MNAFPVCMDVYHVCAQGLWIPERVVADSFKVPCGYFESNQGPLQEKQVLLTPEPTLQSNWT